MEKEERTSLNLEELHKEGLERQYYKKNSKGGVVITKPFEYTARYLYQLASIARAEILATILVIIPLIIYGILVIVNGFEATFKGVPGYITGGLEIIGWIYFFVISMKKLETQNSLSIVNSYFDKSYKYQVASVAASATSKLGRLSKTSFGDSVSAVSGAVSLFCDIKAVSNAVDGVASELGKTNVDFKVKANRVKEAHHAMYIWTFALVILVLGVLFAGVYASKEISSNADTALKITSIFIGSGLIGFGFAVTPNIVFQIIYIRFLTEAGQLLVDAEKISSEELNKFLEEEEQKEKDKKQKK